MFSLHSAVCGVQYEIVFCFELKNSIKFLSKLLLDDRGQNNESNGQVRMKYNSVMYNRTRLLQF